MMIEIRLIDLLNMISEHKPLPKHIKFNSSEFITHPFTYDETYRDYYCDFTYLPLRKYIREGFCNINNKVLIREGEIYV